MSSSPHEPSDRDSASTDDVFPLVTSASPAARRVVRVLTYGTFDLFHIGHLRLLERLRGLGDHLTVAVSTDAFNALKGKTSVVPYEDRAALVAACRFVDEVIPENSWGQKREDVSRLSIDVFGMGGDWEGHFDDLKDLCRVVYLPRTAGISSTEIKDKLRVDRSDPLSQQSVVDTANALLARLES